MELKETVQAYDNGVEEYAAKWLDFSGEPWASWRNEFVESLPSRQSVLDAGCGPGRDTKFFVEQGIEDVHGIELSKGMLEKARQVEPSASYAVMDARKLDYADSSFDGVFCNGVLHHLDIAGMRQAIREFYRVLKPEGVLFVSTRIGYDHNIDTDDKYGPTRTRHLVSPGVLIYPAYNLGFNFHKIGETETDGKLWLSFLARKFSPRDLLLEMKEGALAWGSAPESARAQYR